MRSQSSSRGRPIRLIGMSLTITAFNLLVSGPANATPTVLATPPGEPTWTQHFSFSAEDAPGPPDEPCTSTKYSVKAPKAEDVDTEAPTTPSVDTPEPERLPMVKIDIGDGAKNEHLTDEMRSRLQMGGPFNLDGIPLEPLRGNGADIMRVRLALARSENRDRPTRISFFGASHVAGEFFTGQIRRLLQEAYGDAGHGYVQLGPPWKGYRSSDINLCAGGNWNSDFVDRRGGRDDGRYGPAGIVVGPADADAFGWVQTTKTNPQGKAVSRFEVGFLRFPGGGKLHLSVDGQPPLDVSTDGIFGPGLAVLHLPDGPHRLELKATGNVQVYGSWMEREGNGIVVDAAGVPGRTAASWLAWDMGLVEPYLRRRPPDLVVLAYGTNEANDPNLTPEKYAIKLRDVLTRLRVILPDAACVLVGPSDRGKKISKTTYGVWSATAWVAEVQRTIGPEYGCATWDWQVAMGGPGSMIRGYYGADPKLAAGDLIHLSAEGYKQLGSRFVAVLTGMGD